MRLSFSRQQIVRAPQAWARQYRDTTDPRKAEITRKLEALDVTTATAADVAQIIGNQSWSYFCCDECSQYVEKVVEFGEYESTVKLCTSCLRAGSALASVQL